MGGDAFGVTLLEGQVVVQRSGGTVVMAPGERLRVGRAADKSGRAAPRGGRLDRPVLDQLLAWQRGVAVLDDVSLAEAVAEMNRYSTVPIRGADSQAGGCASAASSVSGTRRPWRSRWRSCMARSCGRATAAWSWRADSLRCRGDPRK